MVRLSPAKQDLLTLLSELFFPNLKQIRDVVFAKLSRILKNVMCVLMGFFIILGGSWLLNIFYLIPTFSMLFLRLQILKAAERLCPLGQGQMMLLSHWDILLKSFLSPEVFLTVNQSCWWIRTQTLSRCQAQLGPPSVLDLL